MQSFYLRVFDFIDNAKPNGLDISRSIKDEKNNISDEKLKKFLQSFSA